MKKEIEERILQIIEYLYNEARNRNEIKRLIDEFSQYASWEEMLMFIEGMILPNFSEGVAIDYDFLALIVAYSIYSVLLEKKVKKKGIKI
jgi:cation transport ATPase